MGSSSINPINESHIAKSLLQRCFDFTCREGFKVKEDKNHEYLLVRKPRAQRYDIKIGVGEVVGMTPSQRNEWCRAIARSMDE